MRRIKRKGWRALKGGGAVWTGDLDDEIEVILEKRTMGDKGDVSDRLEAYLKAIEPGLSYGVALEKHWSDEPVQDLLEAHAEAPPEEIEPAPVEKAAQPGDGAWSLIQKAAQRVKAEVGDVLTEAECVEEALRRDPWLYTRYRQESLV